MSAKTCPICKRKMEDMRHVTVECFYAVDEFVPEIEQEVIFKEIPKEGSYWGHSRTYTEGKRDEFDVKHELDEKGREVHKIINNPVPVDDIRLLELAAYRQNCCKECRHDFLVTFKKWADGELIKGE